MAADQRRHGSARGAAVAAQAAAHGPAREVQAAAEAQQVTRIDEQHPKEFHKAGFAKLLHDRVDAKAPNNPQEARDFPSSGKLGELKTEMTSAAKTSAADAGSDVRDQAQAAPDQSGIEPKPVTPLPETAAAAPPADLNAAQAAPKPMPAAEVSAGVNAQQQQLDDTMTRAKVTDNQLAAANEPTFTQALTDKQAASQRASAVPAQYRAAEAGTIAAAQAQAVAVTGQQTMGMHGQSVAVLGQVTGQQHATMAADQASRANVSAELEQIYDQTCKDVKARLDTLEKDVGAAFDAALTQARQAFESYVQAELDKRYSDLAVWIDDKLLTWGLPLAVKAIFDAGRARFIDAMDTAIDHVSGLVADGLNEAKQMSADGRKKVSEKVAGLDPALRDVGREAAQGIGAKFDNLDQSITAKQDQLVDTLAGKYKEGLQQLDTRITELESEHAGLISKAVGSLSGVIATIVEMKNLLMKVLAKAVDTINVIIADPIRFLGNLAAAVAQGVRSFVANIGTHLKEGFFKWLFGEFAEAGITLPKTWDLKGVFDLVMQILGLTWPSIRKIAVEVVGEPIVKVLETAAEPIIVLIREGPAGLWKWIKDQLSTLKTMVVDEIRNWVITKVIKEGVTWLIGLLNPASAFVKACKAIYDILEFIWTRGKQILEFVSAIVDSIAEIAAGSLGKAAKKVEDALAKSIPVAIGFLAGLLGLGDISETIKGIIEKIQAPVHDAVKWIITKAVDIVKAIGKLLGFGKGEPAAKDEASTGNPIFDSVKGELNQRLGAMEDEEHIQTVAKEVLVEFQDKGLHGLEAVEDQNGDLTIVARGSDQSVLKTFQKKRRAVVLEVTLSEATSLEELKLQASRDPRVVQMWPVRDPKSKEERFAPGGVVTLGKQDKELLARTWNTGEMRERGSNATHAERQFANFLESKPDLKRRISKVEIKLSSEKRAGCSPCPLCAGALLGELGKLGAPGITSKNNRTISFENGLYVNPDEGVYESDALKALANLDEEFEVTGPRKSVPAKLDAVKL